MDSEIERKLKEMKYGKEVENNDRSADHNSESESTSEELHDDVDDYIYYKEWRDQMIQDQGLVNG